MRMDDDNPYRVILPFLEENSERTGQRSAQEIPERLAQLQRPVFPQTKTAWHGYSPVTFITAKSLRQESV